MIVYSNAFMDGDRVFTRDNGLGLEILQYADPVYLDAFDENHHEITKFMEGMSGFSMHGSYRDTFYTSADPLICEVAKTRFLQSVQAAHFHSISKIVFHSVYRKFIDGYSKDTVDNYLRKAIAFWQEFEENIPDGMTVYIENVGDECPETFVRLIEGIASPRIQCCFDIGHAFCNSAVPVGRWIDVLGKHIGHVHLSDNDGTGDHHMPLGKGAVPLLRGICDILEQSGPDTVFVLECDVPPSVEWLRGNGLMTGTV